MAPKVQKKKQLPLGHKMTHLSRRSYCGVTANQSGVTANESGVAANESAVTASISRVTARTSSVTASTIIALLLSKFNTIMFTISNLLWN